MSPKGKVRDAEDLPRYVFSALARQPDDIEGTLSRLMAQIVRTADGDCGSLFELSEHPARATLLGNWVGDGLPDDQTCDVNVCPWILGRVLKGEAIMLPRGPEDLPAEAADDAVYLAGQGASALLVVPAVAGGRQLAVLVQNVFRPASWDARIANTVRFAAEILAAALNIRQVQEELQRTRADLSRAAQRLEAETRLSKEDFGTAQDFDDVVGTSAVFQSALTALREVAPTDTTTLLLGETGTGKELFARTLHAHSTRRHKPFVAVNCASLPASLIESELFGHERGAFTGATSSRQGRFETADGGTILLDEIGDLPMELQPKLLRVLQEREFERVGSSVRRKVDVRVIAATHQDLHTAVAEGRFRADLYYRLSVYPITLPPLRERCEDIPHLVWYLINRRQRSLHRRITSIPLHTMEALQAYHWPGNVRELQNVIERAMIRSLDGLLQVDESLSTTRPLTINGNGSGKLEDVERAHIEATLESCRGRINGSGNAAERLGMHPNTLRFRIKKLGIMRRSG